MSILSPAGSETEVPLPLPPQRQKSRPIVRLQQKKFGFNKLAVLAALIVFVLGWTNAAALPASLPVVQSEKAQSAEVVVVALRHGVPTAAPLPQPQSEFMLEPAPITSTEVVTDPAQVALISAPAASLPLTTLTPTPTITSEIKHVVIISVDGLRPDALELADTPTLDSLIARGAYSNHAQTVYISETLPSHASMLSGMVPEKHGILWGLPYMGWPGMNGPTLFSVAHDAGLSTAMVSGKEKLNYLVLPNSVDKLFVVDAHDTEVKDHAIEFIQAGLPDVLFIHFPDTDRVGHACGWMSANQLQAVTFVDGLIGEIVAALESGSYLDSTLLIITADHGGHGKTNGDDSPIDRTIPWLAVGPGVPAGITLGTNINTYDTAATVLYALHLPLPERWDGQPILEIFP
jgi:hypothetical protein